MVNTFLLGVISCLLLILFQDCIEAAEPQPDLVCPFNGNRASREQCMTHYGNNGDDKSFCKTKGGKYGCHECDKFYNFRRDYCPVMCGLCPKPLVFVSKHDCTFTGYRPTPAECSKMGKDGADDIFCQSRGGKNYGCDYCQFPSVRSSYCPVMCGLCDGPCDGKNCLNGGELDREACKCSCPENYAGESCETLQCPTSDPSYCGGYWPESHCQTYPNTIPRKCPYMCGLCHPKKG